MPGPAPRLDRRPGVAEPVVLMISRREVEAADLASVLSRLKVFRASREDAWLAHSETAPLRREAEAQRERALNCREQAKIERKAAREVEVDRLLAAFVAADRDARDATAKAQAIEDTIYDLKAVNPKKRKTGDVRTPMQLLDAIETKGREVDAALACLPELTSV